MNTLNRDPIDHEIFDKVIGEDLTDLIEKAKVLFGYGVLDTSLPRTMLELGIKPYRRSDVDAYKAKMKEEKNHLPALKYFLATATMGLLTFISSICMLMFSHPTTNFFGWTAAFGGFSSAVIFFGIMVALTEQSQWTKYRLDSEYKKRIPEFALATAVRLKEKCPGAVFFVEELAHTPDPFLIVQDVDGTNYYIEQWDEPGFQKTVQ